MVVAASGDAVEGTDYTRHSTVRMVHGKNGVFIVKNRAEFQALMDLLQATRNPSAEILLDGAIAVSVPAGFSGTVVADEVEVVGGDGGDCIDPNSEPGKGSVATDAPASRLSAANGGSFPRGADGAYAGSTVAHPWIVEIPQDGLDALLASFLEREDGSCVKFVLTNDIAGTFTVAASVTNAVLDLGGHSIVGADGVANGEDGQSAVAFASASTVFSVTGTGTLRGGDGADTVTTDRPGFGAPAVAGAYSAASASTVIDGENGVYVVKNKAQFNAVMEAFTAAAVPTNATIRVVGMIAGGVTIPDCVTSLVVELADNQMMFGDDNEPAVTLASSSTDLRFEGKGFVTGGNGSPETEAGEAARDGAVGVLVPDDYFGRLVASGEVTVQGGRGGDALGPTWAPGEGGLGTNARSYREEEDGKFLQGDPGASAPSSALHPMVFYIPDDSIQGRIASFIANEAELWGQTKSWIKIVATNDVSGFTVSIPPSVVACTFDLNGFVVSGPTGTGGAAGGATVVVEGAATDIFFTDASGTGAGALYGGQGAPETATTALGAGGPAVIVPDDYEGTVTASAVFVYGGKGGDATILEHTPGKGGAAAAVPAERLATENAGAFFDGPDGDWARSSIPQPWVLEIPVDGFEDRVAAFLAHEDASCVRFVVTNGIVGGFTVPASVTNAVIELRAFTIPASVTNAVFDLGAFSMAGGADEPAIVVENPALDLVLRSDGASPASVRGGNGSDQTASNFPRDGAPAISLPADFAGAVLVDNIVAQGGDGGDSIDPNQQPGRGMTAVSPDFEGKLEANGGTYLSGVDGRGATSTVANPWIVYLPDANLEATCAALAKIDGGASCIRFVLTNSIASTVVLPACATNAVVEVGNYSIVGDNATGTAGSAGGPAISAAAGTDLKVIGGGSLWGGRGSDSDDPMVEPGRGGPAVLVGGLPAADGVVAPTLLSVATTPDPADITKGLITLGLAPVADYPTDLFVRVHVAPSSRAPAGTSAVVSVNEVGYQQLDLVAGFNLVAPQFVEIGSDSIGIQSLRLGVADEDATGGDCIDILDENGNPIESFYWFPAEWIGTDMSGWLDAETGLLSETGLENGVSVNVHSEQETSLMVHGEVQMADVGRSVTFGYNMMGNPYPVSIGIQSIQLCVPDEDVSGGDCLNVLDENGNPVASYYWFPGEWIGSETSGWLDAETGELSNVEILPGQGLLLDSTVNDVVVTIKSPFESVP